jgi:hypothetical protein
MNNSSQIHAEAPEATPAIKTIPTAKPEVKKAILEALPTEFNYGGFHYKQIARQGLVAIYRQTWNGIKNPSVAYEVVKIQVYPDEERFGKLIPAHEAMPGPEQWGSKGWTFTSEEAAFAKLKELTQQRKRAAVAVAVAA